MKYVVSRTSICGDEQPCTEAVQESGIKTDQRTFKSVEEYDKRLGGLSHYEPWTSRGINHRKNRTGIARDLPASYWVVDLDADAILKFIDKYGNIVMGSDPEIVGVKYTIEIYDGYRE